MITNDLGCWFPYAMIAVFIVIALIVWPSRGVEAKKPKKKEPTERAIYTLVVEVIGPDLVLLDKELKHARSDDRSSGRCAERDHTRPRCRC